MPRPLSWLPRLSEIRRAVRQSARSHYERKDIERLFQIQPRRAQELIQSISPSARVGRSFLLERGVLEDFLDAISDGADPASLLAARAAPAPRRKLRILVQHDHVPTTLDNAPGNINFEAGKLTISFNCVQDLAGALLALAEILDNPEQLDLLEARHVPSPSPDPDALAVRDDVRIAFEALAEDEARKVSSASVEGSKPLVPLGLKPSAGPGKINLDPRDKKFRNSCREITNVALANDSRGGVAPTKGTVVMLRCGLNLKFKPTASSNAVLPALFWPVIMLKPGPSSISPEPR